MTRRHFAALTKLWARQYKGDEACQRIGTYRWLSQRDGAEVYTETTGATVCDRNSPYFYAREWEAANFKPDALRASFPMLTVFETEGKLSGGGYTAMLEIAIIDVMKDGADRENCRGCAARSANDITDDCFMMLRDFLFEFYETVKFTGTPGSPVEVTRRWYEQLKAADADTPTPARISNFKYSDTKYMPIDVPIKRLYGMQAEINFRFDDCREYVTPTYDITAQIETPDCC